MKKGDGKVSVKVELLHLVEKMNNNPSFIKEEKDRIFQVDLKESGSLHIVLENSHVEVRDGVSENAAVTLTLSDETFSKLLKDELNTTVAFMKGQIKVDGNIGLALKLQEIVKKYQ